MVGAGTIPLSVQHRNPKKGMWETVKLRYKHNDGKLERPIQAHLLNRLVELDDPIPMAQIL